MTVHTPAKVQVGQFLRTILPALLVLLSAVLLGLGYVVYRITSSGDTRELVSPSSYLLPSVDVSWPLGREGDLNGWWIPGKSGSPAIVLVPGHGMNRSDVLSLAAAMRGRGFHVLAFDMRGQGAASSLRCTLGLRETADVLSAIDFVVGRPDIDSARLGIWGVDVGAHAALDAAALRPEVKAIAADSPFDTVADFFSIQLRDDLGPAARFLEFGALQAFRLYVVASSASLHRPLQLDRVADRSILFLQGENRQALARTGESLYDRLGPRKEIVSVSRSRTRAMTGDEMKNYDRQVANFFQLNIPASPGTAPRNVLSRVVK